MLPALIFLIVVTQLPFVATLVISLLRWNALDPGNRGWAGFRNYQEVFTDSQLSRLGGHHDHPYGHGGSGQRASSG